MMDDLVMAVMSLEEAQGLLEAAETYRRVLESSRAGYDPGVARSIELADSAAAKLELGWAKAVLQAHATMGFREDEADEMMPYWVCAKAEA